jgi:CBS domain-containing protein
MPDDPEEIEIFHEVGRLFPGEVTPVTVSPSDTVATALRLMQENRFSQLPVVEDGIVRGVFSLWSLARLVEQAPAKVNIVDIEVEEVMEAIPSVTVNDSLHSIMSMLDQHEALIVASPAGVQALATHSDVLRYFYRVARPYILLQEIELALRALITGCAPANELERCAKRALERKYEGGRTSVPTALEDMSFDDYRSVITNRDNWPLFEGTLGKNRLLIAGKLERIRDLRNTVFHFRDELRALDYETLVAERDWLLNKARRASGRRKVAPHD